MKIVVIGGTGLIGTQLVSKLRARAHEVIAASPRSGVNTLTGEGLAQVLAGAELVVDVANSPSFEDNAVMSFFTTATRNIAAAEKAAGVKHHVALSVVGTERLLQSGYFRAKMVQEELIQEAGVPYTLVRATQFFEFVGAIADFSMVDGAVRLSSALIQPMASEDVAEALAEIAPQPPRNGMVEVAGPEARPLDEIVRQFLSARNDGRKVITDAAALYYGTTIDDRSLTPGSDPRLGKTTFAEWLGRVPA